MLRRRFQILALLAASACTAPAAETQPPADQVFFPTGIAVSPDESNLFVLSANSQLAYDSGTVSVIPIDPVDSAVNGWLTSQTKPSGCVQDDTRPEILNCPAKSFLAAGAGVRIGNFAASLGIQDLGNGDLRLVIPVRGDPSVTYVEWSGSTKTLSCGTSGDSFPLCDDAHRLTHFLDDSSLPQLDVEPYNVFVDSANHYAVVSHLSTPTATLVDLPADGTPVLSDAISGLFQYDSTGTRVGAAGVAGRIPGAPDDEVYITSLSEDRVQTAAVVRTPAGRAVLVPGPFFFLGLFGANGHGSSDTRQVAFGEGGNLGYFLNRLPPSVALVDTSLDPTGVPKNQIVGGTDICRQAVSMQVADVNVDEGERAYVTCFQDGEMYVVDPRGGGQVEQVSTIGRGPFGIAVAPNHKRLYITNFYENTIAVVDLTPGAPTQYRVVFRIGIPKPT